MDDNEPNEIETFLVAVDGSEAAQTALCWACDLATALGARTIVATVVENPADRPDPGEGDTGGPGSMIDGWDQPLVECGVEHELVVLDGAPHTALARLAASRDIDAVVVGTRGTGGFQGLALGGVAYYLAHHIPVPLIAVPRAGGPLLGGTVLIGADGSAPNEQAFRWGAGLAGRLDGKALALFAHSPLLGAVNHDSPDWTYPGENKVREAAERVNSGADPIEVVLAAGSPARTLVEAGESRDASVIVVGRRGWGSVMGLAMGRVPSQLLHHAGRPVAVIPDQTRRPIRVRAGDQAGSNGDANQPG